MKWLALIGAVLVSFTLPCYEPCPERWIDCLSEREEHRLAVVECWGVPQGTRAWPSPPWTCLAVWPVAGLEGQQLSRTVNLPDNRLWTLWPVLKTRNGAASSGNMIGVQFDGFVPP